MTRNSGILLGTRIAAASCLAVVLVSTAAAQQPAAIAAGGRELFERQWVAGEAPQPGGDGLGPVFNHVSCAACHKQGGLGGAGPIDVNASMLSVEVPKLPECRSARSSWRPCGRSTRLPFRRDGDIRPNLILHRFGTDPRYAAMRRKLIAGTFPSSRPTRTTASLQRRIGPPAGAAGRGRCAAVAGRDAAEHAGPVRRAADRRDSRRHAAHAGRRPEQASRSFWPRAADQPDEGGPFRLARADRALCTISCSGPAPTRWG